MNWMESRLLSALILLPFTTACIPNRAVQDESASNADFSVQADSSNHELHKPKLIVVVSVDQMRADFLAAERAGEPARALLPHYRDGFRTILSGGAVFTSAQHAHAFTQTAPGHAVISTGYFPCRNGIVSNEWLTPNGSGRGTHGAYDEVEAVYDPNLVSLGVSPAAIRSPLRLEKPTLGDLLKQQSPSSMVASVAIKDRAAILMGGKKADITIWFDTRTGRWITSNHYVNAAPDWLGRMNDNVMSHQLRYPPATWNKLLGQPDSKYLSIARVDKHPAEAKNHKSLFPTTSFPHSLEYPYGNLSDPKPYELIARSPLGDQLTLDAAKDLVELMNLQDKDIDLLWIGFSSPDYIGHLFGPFSQEALDEYLRLDRVIGDLIRYLEMRLGSKEDFLLVLTADHGAPPIPAFAVEALDSRWERILVPPFLTRVAQELETHGWPDDLIVAHANGFYVDSDSLASTGMALSEVEDEVAAAIHRADDADAVQRVFRSSELEMCTRDRFDLRPKAMFSRNYFKGRSPEVLVQFKQRKMVTKYATGSSHGSIYAYDTHVPLIFYGAGIVPKLVTAPSGPVDIAPTIADIIGLDQPSRMDGISLLPNLRD